MKVLFSEIYGAYFNAVAEILLKASEGNLTDKAITDIAEKKAFSESILVIPQAIKSGEWPLLDKNLKTVLQHRVDMPLTMLQKRWLKALLLDRRIALFEPDFTGLENIEPLYAPDVFVFFDQYTDGDPYDDESYIKCFRTALKAIKEKRMLKITFKNRMGNERCDLCAPYCIEYSQKDDKFRLLTADKGRINTLNMARILYCEIGEEYDKNELCFQAGHLKELVLLLHDERNALERVLLHFSHFEKETLKLDEERYRIKLRYDTDDETEILIRVLSFGPVLEVEKPDEFKNLVKERIRKQMGFEKIG
jgi:hypothetical protein